MKIMNYVVILLGAFLFGCNDVRLEATSTVPNYPFVHEYCSGKMHTESLNVSELSDQGSIALSISRSTWDVAVVGSARQMPEVARLVVFFHGGPRGSLISDKSADAIVEAMGGDTAILIQVAYSATSNKWFDGYWRLKEHGLRAFTCDASILSEYLTDLNRDIGTDHELYLVGQSLGSIPALETAMIMGDAVDGLIIAAPWFFPSPVEKLVAKDKAYISGGKILPGDNRRLIEDKFKSLYEVLQMSRSEDSKEDGDSYLSELLDFACDRSEFDVLFLIAQHEDRIEIQETIDYLSCFEGFSRSEIVKYAFHGMEFQFEASEVAIRDILMVHD